MHFYNATLLKLLAAGQRFCFGANEIQRLIVPKFLTLPEFLRRLLKNW